MIRDDLVREATQLGRQVQQLGNRSAITDLVNRLGVWLDEKRFDEARSIFTEVEQASRGCEDRSQHVITNVLVDLARLEETG